MRGYYQVLDKDFRLTNEIDGLFREDNNSLIKKLSKIGIIGNKQSGKSTLMDMLYPLELEYSFLTMTVNHIAIIK